MKCDHIADNLIKFDIYLKYLFNLYMIFYFTKLLTKKNWYFNGDKIFTEKYFLFRSFLVMGLR